MQQVEFTSRDAECVAYLSALVTVELCNEIHRDKPNTAIRRCVARLLPRLTEHGRVYLISQGLAKQSISFRRVAGAAAQPGRDGRW